MLHYIHLKISDSMNGTDSQAITIQEIVNCQ